MLQGLEKMKGPCEVLGYCEASKQLLGAGLNIQRELLQTRVVLPIWACTVVPTCKRSRNCWPSALCTNVSHPARMASMLAQVHPINSRVFAFRDSSFFGPGVGASICSNQPQVFTGAMRIPLCLFSQSWHLALSEAEAPWVAALLKRFLSACQAGNYLPQILHVRGPRNTCLLMLLYHGSA